MLALTGEKPGFDYKRYEFRNIYEAQTKILNNVWLKGLHTIRGNSLLQQYNQIKHRRKQVNK